jgi:hypothetical protein
MGGIIAEVGKGCHSGGGYCLPLEEAVGEGNGCLALFRRARWVALDESGDFEAGMGFFGGIGWL